MEVIAAPRYNICHSVFFSMPVDALLIKFFFYFHNQLNSLEEDTRLTVGTVAAQLAAGKDCLFLFTSANYK